MLKRITPVACLLAVLVLAGCGSKKEEAVVTVKGSLTPEEEPQRIAVQHILIGFEGSVPGKSITRSLEESRKLTGEVFKRASKGEDFDELVKEYTADAHPGIYRMANHGVKVERGEPVYERGGMVKAFGDVSFSLAVGEIGMTEYDAGASKFGWHIIKRIE